MTLMRGTKRRGRAAMLAAVLAGVMVLGACNGGDGDDVEGGDASTTTVAGEDGAGETLPEGIDDPTGGGAGEPDGDGDGEPTATTAGGSSQTTTGATGASAPPGGTPPEDLGPPGDPGQPQPAATGTYVYDVKRARDAGKLVATGQTRITVRNTGSSAAVRQLHEEVNDQKSEQSLEFRWDRGAMSWDKLTQKGAVCDWIADVVQFMMPVAKGKQSVGNSTCDFTAGPAKVKRRMSGSSTITDIARLKIGGEIVDVWVITRKLRIDNEYFINGRTEKTTRELEETEWFAPKQGMVVKEYIRQNGTDNKGQPYVDQYERVLTSLKPA